MADKISLTFWKVVDSSLKKLAEVPTFHSLLKRIASSIVYYRGPKQIERIVEYPFVFESLEDVPKGSRILDVGCTFSTLPVELAAFGYKVWGIDLLDYSGSHPNFTFVKGSIIRSPFPDEFFNIIVCVSTLEHIGLHGGGTFRGLHYAFIDIHGDKKAVKEMARVTKSGGKIIITVPYGIPYTAAGYRVYDSRRLKEVVKGLKIDEFRTYVYKDDKWVPCSEEEASKVSSFPGTYAVACLRLLK